MEEILQCVLALAISFSLLIWLLRMKRYEPLPRGFVRGMLLWGSASAIVVGVAFGSIEYLPLIQEVGIEHFLDLFFSEDSTEFQNSLDQFRLFQGYMTLPAILWENFLSAAVPEEITKFLIAGSYIKRLHSRYTAFDSVICSSIVAIGFQIIEDLTYLDGDLTTAIVRGITPFHFTYGAIMEFFIGRAVATNQKKYHLRALLIPILIHGFQDFCIYAIDADDLFILEFLIVYIALVILTFKIISKIREMSNICSQSIKRGED